MLALGLLNDDQPFWRTQGVAHAIGVNLTDAMATGQLDRRSYIGMVQRCEACPHAAACTGWLAEQSQSAEGAPGYCANLRAFDYLKARC